MKKIYQTLKSLTVVLSMLSFGASAQIFSTVGTGVNLNTSTSWPAPYGNYWWGSKHQMFITAAEMTAAGIAGGAQISSIGFNISSLNSSSPYIGWTVKIFTSTNADPLASNWISTGQVSTSTVSTVTGTIGWNQTQIAPFIWNGSDNIVVETCFNNSSYTSNYSTYYTNGISGTSVKTRYRYADISTNCTDPSTYTYTDTRPNMRFEWISPTPCSAAPAANSVITPTYAVCPNSTLMIGLGSTYTVGGINYQWQSSTTSSVGPFTSIPGATNNVYGTPNMTVATWYSALLTCSTVLGTTTTASPGLVSVSPVITSNVPYFEGFEGLVAANTLPNCSWAATNLPTGCQTYVASNLNGRTPRTGSKFASFYYTPIGVRAFYTNGIQLDAGVTYSASVWYQTEYYGYNNWTNLSIMYGTTQSTTGLITIASTNGPALSNVYKSLSNTFTVASSGLYYVAVKADGNSSSSAQYLTWDDLSIIIPCTPTSGNSPSVSVSSNSLSVCSGDAVNLTATGADTYTWNTGSNSAILTDIPFGFTNYYVVGTSTLSGCTSTVSQPINVLPSPTVFVIADKASVCAGSPVQLTALGGVTYTWSNGSNAANISVVPAVNTTYSVSATNTAGCKSDMTQLITVNNLPTVTASSNANQICMYETVTLSGSGAISYQWTSSTSPIVYQGSQITVSPNGPTTYTVVGTDSKGCSKTFVLVQNVNDCVGINQITASTSGVSVYPNPTNGDLSVETHSNAFKVIDVVDLTGRVVLSNSGSQETVKINMSTLANGVYYVKIQFNSTTEVIKIVKN